MKRVIVLAFAILLLSAAAGEVDDEALMEAQWAEIPAGLSAHEEEIYRQAFAQGYYAALHPSDAESKYILNTSSHKFHKPTCSGAASIKDNNRQLYVGRRDEVVSMGYSPCGICNP